MAVIVLGLLLRAPAGDDADRIAADLAAVLARQVLGLLDGGGGLLGRDARGLQEEGVAVVHREGAAGGRGAGIHDQRPRAADGLRLGADAFELEIFAGEIEVLFRRPDQLDDVEPFLREFVARFMVALLDAEHLELAFVPADDEVESEAAVADMVGGHASPWRRSPD